MRRSPREMALIALVLAIAFLQLAVAIGAYLRWLAS